MSTMAYSWLLIDRAFFVRWKKLEVASLDKILHDLGNARRGSALPMIYVSITPEDLAVPSGAERAALNEFALKAKDLCEAVHLVIEGDRFKHSIQRTALTSIMFLSQRNSQVQTLIHKQLDDAINLVAPKVGRRPEDIQRALKARGFIDGTC